MNYNQTYNSNISQCTVVISKNLAFKCSGHQKVVDLYTFSDLHMQFQVISEKYETILKTEIFWGDIFHAHLENNCFSL